MTELLFRDDAYLRSCEARIIAVEADGIQLDRTVFYPQGGGQPGDTGLLRLADGRTVPIVDTRKGDGPDAVLHIPAPGAAIPAPGDAATAEIDWERRYRLMRMHTCLHLLCAAVPGAVTGGQIADGKGRLDFDVPGSALDKDAITRRLNELIAADHPATPRWISDEEMIARPELVRTMSVKPPMGQGRVRLLDVAGVDLQPCGGTHLRRTGEIGRVEVVKIENKGKQNRRVVIGFAE
ncbi:MAG TPA: alanyl-tRNA editing protein [Stellaceae bacterium]